MPREKNPVRVTLTDDVYERLLEASDEVDWRFGVALTLAHDTGHRIGAIRQLRWSDIDFEGKQIRWRSEHDKMGMEHTTPILEGTVEVLRRARKKSLGIGEAPVLPSPKDRTRPMSRHFARDVWEKGEKAAGLPPKRGRGWHSCRRKFASEYDELPLKALCELGGWKSVQTVMTCYQHPNGEYLREALRSRRSSSGGRMGPNWAQLAQAGEMNSPARGRNLKRGFYIPQWAWVDLNYRPHAYQISSGRSSAPVSAGIKGFPGRSPR